MADDDETGKRQRPETGQKPRSQDGEQADTAVARAIQQIEDEARRVAVETRLEIQEKTRRWITASGGLLALVVGGLTLFGYKEAYDFRSELQALHKDAEQQLAEVRDDIAAQAQALNSRITQLGKKLSTANEDFQSQLLKLEKAEHRLEESEALLKEANRLSSDFADAQTQVEHQLQQISKLQNSFFDVFVICDAPPSRRKELLEPLRQRLEAGGFVLKPENVFTSTVDRTEVLYYDKSKPDQVNSLVRIVENTPLGKRLRDRGSEVRARFISERNPRELLIKLRAL